MLEFHCLWDPSPCTRFAWHWIKTEFVREKTEKQIDRLHRDRNTHTHITVLLWRGQKSGSGILKLCTKAMSCIKDRNNDLEHLSIISGVSTCRLPFSLSYYLVCYFTLLDIIIYYIKCLIFFLHFALLVCFNTTRVHTAQIKVVLTNIKLINPFSQGLALCVKFSSSPLFCVNSWNQSLVLVSLT